MKKMGKERIIELMAQKKWFHKYEILPGIYTPGRLEVNPGRRLDSYGVPSDLTGKAVLDIGAWDGAYTFEFERRGGAVTALDIQEPDRTGFNVGKKIRNSRAKYIEASVYDLSRRMKNKYDIVFYQGVYYHLKNPLLAFQKIWHVLKSDGIFYFEGAILDFAYHVDSHWKDKADVLSRLSSLPVVYFVKDGYGQYDDPSCWFIPTNICLVEWLEATGYSVVNVQVAEKKSRVFGHATKNVCFKEFEHGKM